MKYNLFLDDARDPNQFLKDLRTWVVVRNYAQFTEVIIKQGLPDFISFDHDLADEHYGTLVDYDNFKEKTGYDCAKWLIEYCMKMDEPLPEWQVHSMNPVGKININTILSLYKDKEDINE